MDATLTAHAALQLRAGWCLILAGLASGAYLGLGFLAEDFLGGYGSPRRRLVRLGHIALVALGVLNILWALCASVLGATELGARCFLAGSLAMPLVCFVVAWRPRLLAAFALPVLLLSGSVAALILGGAR